MTRKMTKKDVLATNMTVIQLLNGECANLLSYVPPYAHTEGIYGINAYVYDIWGVAVVAGNRPFGRRPDVAILKEFDARARVLIEDRKSFESDEVQSLLSDFADEMERV